MSNLEHFQKWAKNSSTPSTANLKEAVVYTRVSSKEQADKNLSLDFQKKTIFEYASKNGYKILSFFGGTYESAKTDGRKEFQRMLDFIKKNKGSVSHILVYTLDRFSRTGGGAIKLAQDLREKYGVTVFAVTQPTDTTNVSGVFQQNIHFLFSEFDNQLRKQRAVAGMKEKFEKGIWCLKPPMGYDIVRTNGERKIVINKTGEQLRKAFKWKKQGIKNEAILSRLKSLGVTIYKQKLSMIFSNPFYCGVIANRMLGGRLVKGTHPAIISEQDFLEVNNIRQSANKYGVSHQKEIDALPLKVFLKCEHCGNSYTGYIVKKKNIYYYKCRTIGCKCNQNATKLNNQFEKYLLNYSIEPEYIEPLQDYMKGLFDNLNSGNKEQEKELQLQLKEVQKKIDILEEKYFIMEAMSEESYRKLMSKYSAEKAEILHSVENCGMDCSNLNSYLDAALQLSSKLATVWASSKVPVKEKLQETIFPDGVLYNHKNESFRTTKVNEVFAWIASLKNNTGENEKGQLNKVIELSNQVGKTGFEPATPWSQTKCSTKLSYFPVIIIKKCTQQESNL